MRWIQEIRDTCGLGRPKQSPSCGELRAAIGVFGGPRNGEGKRDEPRAEGAKDATGKWDFWGCRNRSRPCLRKRACGKFGRGARLLNDLGRYQGSRCFDAQDDARPAIVPSRWSVMCDRVCLVATSAVTARRAFRSNLALRRRITFAPLVHLLGLSGASPHHSRGPPV